MYVCIRLLKVVVLVSLSPNVHMLVPSTFYHRGIFSDTVDHLIYYEGHLMLCNSILQRQRRSDLEHVYLFGASAYHTQP